MPAVSVVIPSVRGGPFLREAIASVRSQTLADWELLIVMDGCEDDLFDISPVDDRIRVIRQPKRGVSIARNVGIMHARSDLIAFLDDDDRMLPERLVAQFKAMQEERIGLCHTQFRVIDESGKPIRPGNAREVQYRDLLQIEREIVLSTAMIRKSLIQEVGGFNSILILGEDHDLFWRIARETKIAFLPEVLVEFRRHANNTWPGNSASGEGIKLLLRQHRLAAQANGERENLRAIRHGLGLLPSGHTSMAMFDAIEARANQNYSGLLGALGRAFLYSPLVTMRVIIRTARRDISHNRLFASVVHSWRAGSSTTGK